MRFKLIMFCVWLYCVVGAAVTSERMHRNYRFFRPFRRVLLEVYAGCFAWPCFLAYDAIKAIYAKFKSHSRK